METVQFGENLPSLEFYENKIWELNETKSVEFFKNKFFFVTLLSVNSNDLNNKLSKIDVNDPIALDLEWDEELCLFQFCYSNDVLIIRHPKGPGNETLFNFMKTHKFFAKGTHNDRIKLKEKFGFDFDNEIIEDIAETRLIPNDHSLNFMKMTLEFAGEPTAIFKDIKITKSDWDAAELSMRQVLYAAFDVVALYEAYPNFPEPTIKKKTKKKHKKIANERKPRREKGQDVNEINNIPRHQKKQKIVYESTERILKHNRILLVPSNAYHVFCYFVKDFNGSSICIDIKAENLFDFDFDDDDIDHIGCPEVGNKKYLIIAFKKDHPEVCNSLHKKFGVTCIKVNCVDPNECTDNDVLFVPSFPPELNDEESIFIFLNSFGFDVRYTKEQFNYIRIQPHRSQQSLIVKTFLPLIDGISVYTFPNFLPAVKAQIPFNYDLEKTKELFSECGTVKNVIFMRRKSLDADQNVIIFFSTNDEAKASVKLINYKKIDDTICYVQRFTDENHRRFLRFFELTALNLTKGVNNEINIRKQFKKYGEIFQCKYDYIFDVYRIQFINKTSAINAMNAENEKLKSEIKTPYATFPPLGTMAFVRNLPFTITDQEVLNLIQQFGKVYGFVYREIDEFMRNHVVEVTYETKEAASACKAALHHQILYNEKLEINVANAFETEAPIWKMQQRKLFLKLNAFQNQFTEEFKDQKRVIYKLLQQPPMNEKEIFNYFSQYGHVLRIHCDYVMFSSPQEANDAHSNNEGTSLTSTSEFVNDIYPEQFHVVNVDYVKKPYQESQPMAVVVDPLPDGLSESILRSYLADCDNYELIIDDEGTHSNISDISNNQNTGHVYKRAIVYGMSKRAMQILHGKLHNQTFNGQLLNLYKYTWHKIPKRPKNYVPFAGINPPKKQPIVVDPIPKGTKASDIKELCKKCGKFTVKIEGSAIESGAIRVIVQPKSTLAKIECFNKLKEVYGEPKRIPRDEIPPILDDNLEEESDFE